MTALTATASPPLSRPFLPLVRAEVLKLRKNRGLVLTAAAMTVGAMIVAYTILLLLHAFNPDHHGPAGGVANLGNGVMLLAGLGSVAAILVGAAAGAADLSSGVFRELVVTGRSRLALFASRIPSGLTVLFSLVSAAVAIVVTVTVGFAGSLAAPSAGLLAGTVLWLLVEIAFYFAVALGLASLLGSRAQTIAILLAWRMAVTPILLSIGALGVARDAVPGAAFNRLAPDAIGKYVQEGGAVSMSVIAAIVALVAWTAIAVSLGAWRTATRDA
ncbi:MAG: hypothetical protein E6G60_13640 [Actinobacteria bacterium]|nr:MAG: hypothetical protein E6G60_13640 [Actinomycetota bacterium]